MRKILLLISITLSLTACMPALIYKMIKKKPVETKRPAPIATSEKLPLIYAPSRNKGGFSRTNYLTASRKLTQHIENGDIQIVNEGHRITLIIPTDKYFIFDTPKLNDLRYEPLSKIAKLIECFPDSKIYVAGFTDDVGDYEHKRILSKERAQAVATYMWTQGISERKLEAQGYGARYAHANNDLIHGSALNRRIEIQWTF